MAQCLNVNATQKNFLVRPLWCTLVTMRDEHCSRQRPAHPCGELSSVENLGWLFEIGDYTTQLYGDYNKPI